MKPAAIFLAAVLAVSCAGNREAGSSTASAGSTSPGPGEWFVDKAKATGLDFVHFNGMTGEFYYPENMPPGVGLLDYDNDGDLDVYFVQGQLLDSGKTFADALMRPQGPMPPRDRLFRNDLTVAPDGTRTLKFTDVTSQSRIPGIGYGMGVATGDFNNDGWIDLYVTRFGPNQLLKNNGDGTFSDVSRESRTDDPSWSVSAAFVDFDRDGWLDLKVGNYLNYSLNMDQKCTSLSGSRDYCPPRIYTAQPSRIFRNLGDGTFVDETGKSQMAGQYGPALGITTADFDNDGWIDIYVANDGHENLLWMNQRNGTFKNTALVAGAGLTAEGKAEASMGVDAGDFDNDGDEDLFITELSGEGHNLFVNDGTGNFEDQGTRSGLGPGSLPYTGFGTSWIDFDNDGWLDILTVNGSITNIEALERVKDPFPRHQPKQLFRNLRNGRFEVVTDRAGAVFQLSEVGRGAAFGDIDNDGDMDVVVGNDSGPARLLINEIGNRQHWVGLRLVGGSGRDMLGARVEILRKDGSIRMRRARSDGSYASANDPRVLVGLGDSAEVPRIRVRWPDGTTEEWSQVPIDRWTTLRQGKSQ
jgi:hypothetical protein